MAFLGTNLFWITIEGITLVTCIIMILGRAFATLFPCRLKPTALFYLSPILGLSILTIIASLFGRLMPFNTTVFFPMLLTILLIAAIKREKNFRQLLSHTSTIIAFTLLCGSSLLLPLFMYGGFNAHNDAFTYLVHSNWLQTHAFFESIPTDAITPSTTQIALYQHLGLRMGASFLLAMVQALLHLQWSYDAYSTVTIVSIASCCLAIGFPLAMILKKIPRYLQLLLLSLPSFSLGGLIFGANFGFLPQTLGISLAASLLFILGPLLRYLSTIRQSRIIFQTAIPCAFLFSAVVYSYSEFLPFLLFAILISSLLMAWRFQAWKNLTLFCLACLLFSLLILNTELIRTYAALRLQSSAIVGTAFNWNLIGYLAHALGIHGGAWDIAQWTLAAPLNLYITSGYCFLFLILALFIKSAKQLKQLILSGVFLPTIVVLLSLGLGFIYFRYFVQAPFPIGKGQSWSQFKLTEWAHPFLVAMMLFAFVSLIRINKKFMYVAISVVSFISLASALWMSTIRIQPLLASYPNVDNLQQFYLKFRKEALLSCPSNTPIYLAIPENNKLKQMMAYFLADQELHSDWHNDGYIYPWLPQIQRSQLPQAKQCIVETIRNKQLLEKGTIVGPLQVGMLSDEGQIQIIAVSGTYKKESNEGNWWYWVENKAHFKFAPLFISKKIKQIRLQFEYSTRDKQQLTLHIMKKDHTYQNIVINCKGNELLKFNQIVNISPNELSEIIIETDGTATPLGEADPRKAAWIIRNLSVSPITIKT